MNCKTCREEIEESKGGQPLSQSASAHVKSCPNCFAFREERLALRQMIGSLEVVAAPADFDFRLRARLAALKGRKDGSFAWNRFAPGARSLALAATFVVIVAIGAVIKQLRVVSPVDSGTQRIEKVNANEEKVTTKSQSEPRTTAGNIADVDQSPNVRPSPKIVIQRRTSSTNLNDASPRVIVSNENTNDGGGSVDSSVSSAANVLPPGISDPTVTRSVVAVPVRVSMRPATITLNDGSAKPQTISLRPVTFGEQDVFEQPSAKWGFVTAVRGIW